MGTTPSSAERSKQLRKLIADHTVMAPGAINALSARLIEREGFEVLYVSGAVLSNSVGGVPDTGLMTLSDSQTHCARIAQATTLPIISDADTGYGGPENAAETVRVLEAAGVSGIHLEDQVFPKRCGHLDGKELVSETEFAEKIAAAVEAKTCNDFVLIARTDARGVSGYDEAVRRANAYLDAGADMIFPEALQGEEEFARFAKDVDAPLLANMTEFGKSPLLTFEELNQMGYAVALYPVTLLRIAMRAIGRSSLSSSATTAMRPSPQAGQRLKSWPVSRSTFSKRFSEAGGGAGACAARSSRQLAIRWRRERLASSP